MNVEVSVQTIRTLVVAINGNVAPLYATEDFAKRLLRYDITNRMKLVQKSDFEAAKVLAKAGAIGMSNNGKEAWPLDGVEEFLNIVDIQRTALTTKTS